MLKKYKNRNHMTSKMSIQGFHLAPTCKINYNFAKKQKILRLNPSVFGFKTLLIQHDRYNASRFHDAPIFHDSLIFCNNES